MLYIFGQKNGTYLRPWIETGILDCGISTMGFPMKKNNLPLSLPKS